MRIGLALPASLRIWKHGIASALFALTLAFGVPHSAQAVITPFATGSLIVPMDTGTAGQNNGMLTAYGLVYELLRNEVPVYWVINPAKAANGDDFAIATSASLQDVRTGATVTSPRSYRGGPFVIAASDAAAALPIIQAWQAAAGDATSVHKYIGAGSFSGEVSRQLVRAPRIGIIKDGNETIAFNNFNAARIADASGNVWSPSSPDLLTEADLAGPTTTSHRDGVLFSSPLVPRYGFIAAMHYNTTATTEEVVAEVRSWLSTSSLLHLYAQCEAIRTFENATSGLFLTNAGLDDDGSATTAPANRVPSSPLTQLDGTFEVDSGAVDSFRANVSGGSDYKTGVTTLINDNASNLLQRITMLTGRLDGQSLNGQVTYLAGHDYSLDLPITTNPQTNGIRLFLNALLKSDCATSAGQQDVSITKSAPATTDQNEIPYTITLQNPVSATASAEDVVVKDRLPAGTTYVVSSGSPAPTSTTGGVLTWNLPPIAPGATTTVTFRVAVTVDGNYSNTTKVGFAGVTIQSISSSPAVTVRDTGAPTPTPTPRQMVNLSSRAEVGTGDNVTIAGFIIHSDPPSGSSTSGTATPTKKVLLRGIGPSLAAYNIAGTLQDPVLDLYDGNGVLIESNDDWATSPGAAEMISRGLAPSDPHESAILRTLDADANYTAILSGKDNTTGVGLVEAYDVEATSNTHLVNISARAFVDTGDHVLIGGMIVKGDTAADIIVRALGPSLTSHGITNALADPILELHDGNGELLETNDNWMDSPRKDDIIAAGLAPSDEHESAMYITPVPGNYTGIVRGVADGTGVALIEMYRFPSVAH
jgi:uncharacterized repeat protein (TIGR01451 family)